MTKPQKSASTPLAELLSALDIDQLEVNLFRGHSPEQNRYRVYGGQVLAQSLMAALRTISEPRFAHSLHAYFLLAGDPKARIIYEVERVRDGGSFATRRVKAIQHGKAIYVMSASFQREEDGFDHQSKMPDVPTPDQLPSHAEILEQYGDQLPDGIKKYLGRAKPFDFRLVEMERYLKQSPAQPVQHLWVRATDQISDDEHIHKCVLTYASDFTILDTALIAHGRLLTDPDLMMASLDHAIWFHRKFRADEWLLYVQDSPSGSGARGFSRGSVYSSDGALVASVTQEGLIRVRKKT